MIGSIPYTDDEVKEPVKLMALKLMNEQFGITEKDFLRAEVEFVPAHKARDAVSYTHLDHWPADFRRFPLEAVHPIPRWCKLYALLIPGTTA